MELYTHIPMHYAIKKKGIEKHIWSEIFNKYFQLVIEFKEFIN